MGPLEVLHMANERGHALSTTVPAIGKQHRQVGLAIQATLPNCGEDLHQAVTNRPVLWQSSTPLHRRLFCSACQWNMKTGSYASDGNVAHRHPHYNPSVQEAPIPPNPKTASFESMCFSAQVVFFHPHVNVAGGSWNQKLLVTRVQGWRSQCVDRNTEE